MEAYLAHPDDLAFAPESLGDLAGRMAEAATAATGSGDEVVLVSHQDPVHALVRRLTGIGFARFHEGKPGHAEVISLLPGPTWERS